MTSAPDTPAPAAAPLGVVCPTPGCGNADCRVLFTRKAVGQILRTKKCERCRRRFRTAERIVCTNSPGRAENPAPAA